MINIRGNFEYKLAHIKGLVGVIVIHRLKLKRWHSTMGKKYGPTPSRHFCISMYYL